MLEEYMRKLHQTASRGDAREESFYPALQGLIEAWAEDRKIKNVHVTTLPKKTEAGNPDFRVWDGKTHITGYIEAKAPVIEHLDQVETSEQIQRYLQTFPNLILTNFFEFRLYRNGVCIEKVQTGRPFVITHLKEVSPPENEDLFSRLMEKFFSFRLPRVHTAKSLAIELANRTRFFRDDVIKEELREETENGGGTISGFYEAFRRYLISDLTRDGFADLYCQTITYGLFAARTRARNGFNRKLAYDYIPHTIGILREIFRFISLGELPPQMQWIVDDISGVLAVTDVHKILHDYFHEGKGRDPIVHFYETFLAEYDPETREKRGVYYTPEPVVSYIVRSVHKLLKERFKKTDGFADPSVTVLDPAAGTLTFITEAARVAVEEFVSRYGDGAREEFIRQHILQNFYAFELMIAPYAIGHLKAGFLLEEMGYRLREDERFKLFLTNTLEMKELEQTALPGMASLSEESHEAGRVKKEQSILVVMGNPPYSGHSSNVGEWISREIRKYFVVDGGPLGERNPKWLQDDYVKFIRFAQWKVEDRGEGIVAFITNHAYLDNPTFRGMRQSLMETFNEIYILDLHGNSFKKEQAPDGSKDKNVFDIRQGVSIGIFVKKKGNKNCKVYHADLWGERGKKYHWLLERDIETTEWRHLRPKAEFYLLVPRDESLLEEYQGFPKVTDIFSVNSVGIVTARDSFVIDEDRHRLLRRIRQFRDINMPDEVIATAFKLRDKSTWKIKDARRSVQNDKGWESAVTRILYRPFDRRWVFYHDAVIERPRRAVMQHMMKKNIGLVTVRQVAEGIFNHALVTDCIVESRITLSNKGIGYVFPLYLYQVDGGNEENKEDAIIPLHPRKRFQFNGQLMLHEPEAGYGTGRRPNLSPQFLEYLKELYRNVPSPEEIFHYIYAILYSNRYRERYAEFLKIDFPRVPFTKDNKLFRHLSRLGEKLVSLHLMKEEALGQVRARFHGSGNGRVERLRYISGQERLWLNKTQYFEGINEDVFNYQVGGYRPIEKYLRDRRGRTLGLEEIRHYCSMVTVVEETIKVQEEIDRLSGRMIEEVARSGNFRTGVR